MADSHSYEQLILLRLARDEPITEAATLASWADCSWDELFALLREGLIGIGDKRFPYQIRPMITDAGLLVIEQAEKEDII
jgi:hypothetical protein